jgi:predicted dehydrogenase
MKRIRAGIVGVGKIGRAQIEAIRKIDYAEVAAIVVRNGDKAKAIARDLGIPRCHTDYRELLADPEIDVVHNCTPNLAHFPINRDAILAGKAILSEKPLTVDSRESAELVELAKARSIPAAVNFTNRHYPAVRRLKAMLEGGELGKIYAVHGAFLQDWMLKDTDYDWRVEARLGGPSRAMADIGSHLCDIARFLLGLEIDELCADLATFIPGRLDASADPGGPRRVIVDTEDYCGVLARFSGGVRGTFTISQMCAGRKTGLSIGIDGSEASAAWDQANPGMLRIGRRDKPFQDLVVDPGIAGGAFEQRAVAQKAMIESFYRTILYGEAPLHADFTDGHRIVRVTESALASAKKGAWIHID